MSLDRKNDEASELASDLADSTGSSMTKVVVAAQVEAILAIGRDCAKHMREPYLSIDHGDFLHDEFGLPKRLLTLRLLIRVCCRHRA